MSRTWHMDDQEEAAAWCHQRWVETQAAWAAIDADPVQDDDVRAMIKRWMRERPEMTGHGEHDTMTLLGRLEGEVAKAKAVFWVRDWAPRRLGALVRFRDVLRGDRETHPTLYFLAYGEERPTRAA